MREVFIADCAVVEFRPGQPARIIADIHTEPTTEEQLERARERMREAMRTYPNMTDTQAKSEADRIAIDVLALPFDVEPEDDHPYYTIYDAALDVFDHEGK